MSIKRHPLDWHILKWRAVVLIVVGMKNQAMEVFEEMLKQFPNDVYAINSLAYLKTECGDKEGAITDYKRLILSPDVTAATWYNLASCKRKSVKFRMLNTVFGKPSKSMQS